MYEFEASYRRGVVRPVQCVREGWRPDRARDRYSDLRKSSMACLSPAGKALYFWTTDVASEGG